MRIHGHRLAAAALFLVAAAGAQAPTAPTLLPARPSAGCRVIASRVDTFLGPTTWPGGVVPFSYAANVTTAMQAAMQSAMLEFRNVTNVTFVPRTNELDFVLVTDSTINSSPVGRVGGGQLLHITNWNQHWQIVHELMHVLGFWHEHQRPDRDQFVAVQSANVDPLRAIDYRIVPTGRVVGAYDFDSLTHFADTEGGIGGAQTIVVLPPNQAQQTAIGQRTHFSAGDVAVLVSIYGGTTPPTISTLTPSSVPSYQPPQVRIDGLLINEVLRVWVDNSQIGNFTVLSPTALRFPLPNLPAIGQHQIQVESLSGRSNAMPLTVTATDPPVLVLPGLFGRTFTVPVSMYGDATSTDLIVVSFDNTPSILPGIVSLGIGNQFQALAPFATGVGAPSGQFTFGVRMPPTVPSGAIVWMQGISYDLQNLTPPLKVTNFGSVRVF